MTDPSIFRTAPWPQFQELAENFRRGLGEQLGKSIENDRFIVREMFVLAWNIGKAMTSKPDATAEDPINLALTGEQAALLMYMTNAGALWHLEQCRAIEAQNN
ncbi:MAG: hypothetical protein C0483_14120 [Pirellula sp.]|nr:hypothetical protein [Pirellula sp.]